MLHCPQIPAALRRDAAETRARRARLRSRAVENEQSPVDNLGFAVKSREMAAESREITQESWPTAEITRTDLWAVITAARADSGLPPLPDPEPLTINRIVRAAADLYGVTVSDIHSDRRTARYVRARHVAMYLAKTLTPRSLPYIGRAMGDRDHTTVLSALRRINRLSAIDRELADEIAHLKRVLGVVEEEQETPWPASGQ